MKKVFLINANMEQMPYPVAPVGLSLIAKALKGKYVIKVFDAAFQKLMSLKNEIETFNPDYIGIGIRNIDNVTMGEYKFYLHDIKIKIFDIIHDSFNGPVIIGGSGFSIAPVELLTFFDSTYGIVGEGEESFLNLLENLDLGIDDILSPNIISKQKLDYSLIQNDTAEIQLPFSDIDNILDYDHYFLRGSYPIQTKRGCSFKCVYCSYPTIEGSHFRLRNPSEIVDEIQDVSKKYPKISFEFIDSTFNAPLKHALAICDEIIKRGLDIKLRTMGVNPGHITEELIFKMKSAGFSQIDCTPESASESVLKKLRKNFNLKKLREAAKIIAENDLPTMWFFMFGAPGETRDTVLETFQFIDDHIARNDMVHVTEGIRIFRGTELFDLAVNQGLIKKDISVFEKAFYVSPSIDKQELHTLLLKEIAQRRNVVHADNSTPNDDLLRKAILFRKENNIDEPMFRTLLKLQ